MCLKTLWKAPSTRRQRGKSWYPGDLMPGEGEEPLSDMSGKASKGASWTLVGALFVQVLGLVRTAALARLLSLSDFGIAGLALTVIGALYTLTNTGVAGSVIIMPFERKKELHEYSNSVWTMEVIRGVVIALILALLAVPMALFYREPRLVPVLLILALTPLFTSTTNIGLGLQARRMQFNKTTIHGMVSGLLTTALTIFLAWSMHNYWALVWSQIAGAGIALLLSFIFSSYRPRLNFDLDNMRKAFDFGKHIFIIGLATFVLTMMDNVVVGRVMGATALGVYMIAYAFCNLPRTFTNTVFNTILFPMFASVEREQNANRISSILERSVTMACVILLTTITPLIILSPAIIRIIYGTKWVDAVGPMRILLLAGFFVSMLGLFSTFLVGTNRPQIESKAKILDAAFFLAIIYPFTLWQGTLGAALGSCLTSLISLLYRWYVIVPIAPQACRRIPGIIASALLCLGALSGAVMVLMELAASRANLLSFGFVFSPALPALSAAWLQLILGLPLLAVASLGCFVLTQPMARGEVRILWAKAVQRLKRGAD